MEAEREKKIKLLLKNSAKMLKNVDINFQSTYNFKNQKYIKNVNSSTYIVWEALI